MNRILENIESKTPVLGMGVTKLGWSDRSPYTIIEIHSTKEIVVQEDKSVRIDKNGLSEQQEWEISSDPEGRTRILTLRKNGKWITKGVSLKNGDYWLIGERMRYYDPHF